MDSLWFLGKTLRCTPYYYVEENVTQSEVYSDRTGPVFLSREDETGKVAAASRALVLVQNPEITMVQASALSGEGPTRIQMHAKADSTRTDQFLYGAYGGYWVTALPLWGVVEGIPAGMVHHLIAPALLTIIPAG